VYVISLSPSALCVVAPPADDFARRFSQCWHIMGWLTDARRVGLAQVVSSIRSATASRDLEDLFLAHHGAVVLAWQATTQAFQPDALRQIDGHAPGETLVG